jgi:hypothetical protein
VSARVLLAFQHPGEGLVDCHSQGEQTSCETKLVNPIQTPTPTSKKIVERSTSEGQEIADANIADIHAKTIAEKSPTVTKQQRSLW